MTTEELLKYFKNIADEDFVLTEDQLKEILKPKNIKQEKTK